jgi:EAL domain-containing protein (putative c-di-GMP-specific phosphodiesterase class I)
MTSDPFLSPAVPPDANPPLRPNAADLAGAIARREIRTEFQPKVALATGELVGMEALARWTDAELGAVAPDLFIALAEREGLVAGLTALVLEQALAAAQALRRRHPAATVAVNISPVLLDDPALPGVIAAALAAAALPASALVAEVTEGTPFANPARAAQVLTELSRHGVTCAMDDFGTGYATLPALLQMPFTELKIDRSFVAHCTELPEAAKLVRATIRLAQALGLRVVAEGVETEAAETLLREAGCDVGQGFRYGKAMPMAALLSRWPGSG